MAITGTIPQTLYHGTRADLKPGDLLAAGYGSNYGARKQASWIYLTGTMDANESTSSSPPARFSTTPT